MNREKKPLYRKVNTKARGVHHWTGPDARHTRNTKQGMTEKMKQDVRRGLDYTPLFKFLLSKVGQNFDEVYSEAMQRLEFSNNDNPIFWMVVPENDRFGLRKRGYFYSENAIYSALYVDENGLLQYVNPDLKNENFAPSCSCCTHTFNGNVLSRKYLSTDHKTDTLTHETPDYVVNRHF